MYLPGELGGLVQFGGGYDLLLATVEYLLLVGLYFAFGEGGYSFEGCLFFVAAVLLHALFYRHQQCLSIEQDVLNWELHPEILIQQIPDVFEVLKFAGHVFGVFELPALGEVEAIKDEPKKVSVLKISEVVDGMAQFDGVKPVVSVGVDVSHCYRISFINNAINIILA